jgi:hypothetical protein
MANEISVSKIKISTCFAPASQPASQPTNSIEQGPWKANSHLASQEISRRLLNPKFHYSESQETVWS